MFANNFGKGGFKQTPESIKNRKYVTSLCKTDGIPIDLDLSDEKVFTFLLDERGGEPFLKNYFPHYHRFMHESRNAAIAAKKGDMQIRPKHMTLLEKVAAGEDVSSNWYDLLQIPTLVAQKNETARGVNSFNVQSTAVVSFIEGLQWMNATLTIGNPNTGEMIAQTSTAQTFDQGYDTIIMAQGDTNNLDGIEASLSIDGVPYQTGIPIHKVLNVSLMDYIDPSQPITVTDPAHKATKPNVGFMKICMGRSARDCDYIFDYQPSGQDPTPYLTVSGSVTYAGKITPPSDDSNKFGLYFYVRKRSGGGTQFFTGTDAYKYFTLSNDAHTLSWNFPKAAFESAPWNQGEEVDMNMTVKISVDSLIKNTVFMVTSLKGVIPNMSIAKIDDFKFVWGCLADDSKIRMKDGTEKRINFVQSGEEVLTDNRGSFLVVDDIVTGIEEKPCLRIITETGRSLLVTDNHPIATPDGFNPANELSPGDLVITESGAEKVISITKERYLGIVYNLKLGVDHNPETISSGATHFANGILVGDGNKQNALLDQRLKESRMARAMNEISEDWRLDAENTKRLKEGEVLIPYIL